MKLRTRSLSLARSIRRSVQDKRRTQEDTRPGKVFRKRKLFSWMKSTEPVSQTRPRSQTDVFHSTPYSSRQPLTSLNLNATPITRPSLATPRLGLASPLAEASTLERRRRVQKEVRRRLLEKSLEAVLEEAKQELRQELGLDWPQYVDVDFNSNETENKDEHTRTCHYENISFHNCFERYKENSIKKLDSYEKMNFRGISDAYMEMTPGRKKIQISCV